MKPKNTDKRPLMRTPQSDEERGEAQTAALEQGRSIPFFAKAAIKELLKPPGSSGKR